jgi:hypothetical protein
MPAGDRSRKKALDAVSRAFEWIDMVTIHTGACAQLTDTIYDLMLCKDQLPSINIRR